MKLRTVHFITVASTLALASGCATGDIGYRNPSSEKGAPAASGGSHGAGGGSAVHSVGSSGQVHTNGNKGATPPAGKVGTNPNHGSPGGHGGGTSNVTKDSGTSGSKSGGSNVTKGNVTPVNANKGGRDGSGPTGHANKSTGQHIVSGPRGNRTVSNFADPRNHAQIHQDARFLDPREFDLVHFDWRWSTFHQNNWWQIWGIPSYAGVQYVTCEAVDADTGLIYPTTEALASTWTDDDVNWILENALDDCEANLNLASDPNDVCVPVDSTNGCFWDPQGTFPADDSVNFDDDITPQGGWVAIVFNVKTGAWGSYQGAATRAEAETQALIQCGSDCAGVDASTLEAGSSSLKETWTLNGWVALARDPSGHWGTGGEHDSQADAESSALSNCNRGAGTAQDCGIVSSLSSTVSN